MTLLRKFISALSVLIFMVGTSSYAQKSNPQDNTDSLVVLMSAKSMQQYKHVNGLNRKVIDARFLHNRTYLICDTAIWNVDRKVIDAFGHVKVMQEQTVLTSDRLEYYIDESLAKFRGSVVQLIDKDRNTLRTRYLDYNTKDSIAVFDHGGAMKDKDGQVIESVSGTYDSKARQFSFSDNVNMYVDSVFVKTRRLLYESATSTANFYDYIDAWQEDNMLSAKMGKYNRGDETFYFWDKVHATSKEQEGWADTLHFFRITNDVKMFGNAQVTDTTRNVSAMADRIIYQDSLSLISLLGDAVIVARTDENNQVDTVYSRADRIYYRSLRKCDVDSVEIAASKVRIGDLMVDPVNEYRAKAAEAAAKSAAEAMDPNDPNLPPQSAAASAEEASEEEETETVKVRKRRSAKKTPKSRKSRRGRSDDGQETQTGDAAAPQDTLQKPDTLQVPDSLLVGMDTLIPPVDTLLGKSDTLLGKTDTVLGKTDTLLGNKPLPPADTIAQPADTMKAPSGAAMQPADTTAPSDTTTQVGMDAPADSSAVADSLAAPLDSTKVAFVTAVGNVRVFRKDMQMKCDSLAYSGLDSLARLYVDPLVWSEGDRQYSSDSLTIVMKNGKMEKASLTSNAFIIIQEGPEFFDQIRGAEILAYFDTTSALRRFDALGGSTALFFLQENDAYATVNKVESKMLSANFKDGDIDHVYYYDTPKNDAYPTVQLPKEERKMKGFNWQPELRPADGKDISDKELRKPQRAEYAAHPKATFKETDVYFPGYMKGVYEYLAKRDSLKKVRERQERLRRQEEQARADSTAHADSLHLADSLKMADRFHMRDSLGLRDSLLLVDSLRQGDTLLRRDSLDVTDSLHLRDSLGQADSLHVSDTIQTPHVPTPEELRAMKAEERQKKREARQAAKEERWARLDARDAEKAAAKERKALEKKRKRTWKQFLANMEQEEKDRKVLEKYVRMYQERKEREALKETKKTN